MRRLKIHGYAMDNARPTRVTLKFDENRKLLNPQAAAHSSMVGWGAWQTSRKVPCSLGDCWYVTCAGHGGYLLVTQTRLDETRYGKPALDITDAWGDCYVYEFEEDCAWAILEYFDAKTRAAAIKYYNKRENCPKLSEAEYTEKYILPTLKQYFPETLTQAA